MVIVKAHILAVFSPRFERRSYLFVFWSDLMNHGLSTRQSTTIISELTTINNRLVNGFVTTAHHCIHEDFHKALSTQTMSKVLIMLSKTRHALDKAKT